VEKSRRGKVSRAGKQQAGLNMKSIPINPKLPPDFFCTPNDERSPEEIEAWWGVPFIETEPDGPYFVRCLDGGAWDRPSLHACCESLDEAIKAAEGLLAGRS